jgi:hypothetical protein
MLNLTVIKIIYLFLVNVFKKYDAYRHKIFEEEDNILLNFNI